MKKFEKSDLTSKMRTYENLKNSIMT